MQKRFRLDLRHYHHLNDPEISDVFELLHLGLMTTPDFVRARLRDDIVDWLRAYSANSWDVQHVVVDDSAYWFCTDDDKLATMFKLTWM